MNAQTQSFEAQSPGRLKTIVSWSCRVLAGAFGILWSVLGVVWFLVCKVVEIRNISGDSSELAHESERHDRELEEHLAFDKEQQERYSFEYRHLPGNSHYHDYHNFY